MPRVRLGVALLLPPGPAGEVQGVRRAVGDPAVDRIPPHVTLVPPVNVRDDRLDEALAVVRAAAERTRPFPVMLGPPATFLPDNPVLYLAVDDDAGRIASLRDLVFAGPLARPLTWPFVAHLTLADGIEPERIGAALTALAGYRLTAEFDRVHVLQEDEGRIWRSIAEARFAAAAVIGRGGLPLEITRSARLDPVGQRFADRAWSAYDAAEMGGPLDRADMALTARRDGEVVGVAVGRVEAGVGYLSELIVDEGCRGEGIGHHLLAAFESWAAERGVHRLALRTLEGGPADGFYRRRGWRAEARLEDWYAGRTFVQLRRDLA